MKTIICIITLLLIFSSIAYCQSVLEYQSGTSIEVQSGADVSANTVIINGTYSGGGTINGVTFYVFNLYAIVEGLYDPSSNSMVSDSAEVYLRNSVSPYTIVDSKKSILNSSGVGTFIFSNAVNGTSYYVVVTHRNSIETWSKTVQIFTGGSITYNFTTAETQAFGDNLKQVDVSPVTFAIYSGDVNQDGIVDVADASLIDNDAFNFISGYVPTDVDGNDIVDLSDAAIADNNGYNFVVKVIP